MNSTSYDLSIPEIIREFFNNVESAHKSEIYNYISYKIDAFLDLETLEKELKKLESEQVLKIEGDIVILVSELPREELEIYEIGPWNYQLSINVELPHRRMIDLNQVYYKIDDMPFLKEKNNIFHITSLDFNRNKLLLEVSCDEWEGTATIYENQIEIETIWKINDNPLPEWSDYVINEHPKSSIRETYLAMPAIGHALFLYFAIKSFIVDIHHESQFKILKAELVRAKSVLKKKD